MGYIVHQSCIGFYTYKGYGGTIRCQFKGASATMQCKEAIGIDMYIITNEENFKCAWVLVLIVSVISQV